jgi:hypothetical protein
VRWLPQRRWVVFLFVVIVAWLNPVMIVTQLLPQSQVSPQLRVVTGALQSLGLVTSHRRRRRAAVCLCVCV